MTPELPKQVKIEMAKREHRLRHYLWHGVRNSWARLTDVQKQEILKLYPGWEPIRPALDAGGIPIRDNLSGEDFLYMHRQMIAEVNKILSRVGDPNYPKVEGWAQVPPPGDPDYPVPELPGLEEVKSDDYYRNVLAPWERQYKSEEYLKEVTLGQLGVDLEWTIHNDMHMRWAAPSPVGYRPRGPLTQLVDSRWDNPDYDFLGDTYSSHVNPIFWKLHGWADDRIEDWKRVNGIVGDIQWEGTWVGPMGHPHRTMALFATVQPNQNEMNKLERVATILSKASAFDGFFRPVSRRDK